MELIPSVGRAEIEELKGHRKSFLNSSEKIAQRSKVKKSKKRNLLQVRTPPGRPVCTTCTGMTRSTARLTVTKERVDRLKGTTLGWSRSTGPVDRGQGRSTDAFCSPFRIRTPFLFYSQIQLGFPKSLRLFGYKYALEPSWIVSLKVSIWYSLVLIVESIKSLSPLPRGCRQIAEPR